MLPAGSTRVDPDPPVAAGPRRGRPRRWVWPGPRTWWPLAVLVAADVAIWARLVLPHFSTLRLANPGDSESFALYMSWNLHALTHAMNPFHIPYLYAPGGEDVSNGITMPVIGVLVSPVTALWGGTAGYNAAFLLGMLTASWAVFLLARELAGSAVAGTIAGVLMMVSPYLAGHALGHLNLLWVFGLPYLAYLTLRLNRGTLSRPRAMAAIAGTFFVTAGASTELVATQTLFAVIAFGVALLFLPRAGRHRLLRTLPTLGAGGLIGAVLASPILYVALREGRPEVSATAPTRYAADLSNVISSNGLQALPLGQRIPELSQFQSNVAENTAYLPIVLLLFVIGYAILRRSRLVNGLLVFAVIALILSFGPRLPINGTRTIWMPWSLFLHVPGIDAALPNRFTGFAFIAVLLVLTDAWIAVSAGAAAVRTIPRWVTGAVAGLSFVMLWPNSTGYRFPISATDGTFVTSGEITRQFAPGENVLVLPGGQDGPGFRWLEATDFYFRMPTGNGGGGTAPAAWSHPVARAIFFQNRRFDFRSTLLPYLRNLGVHTVVVPQGETWWKSVADSALPARPVLVDEIWIYRLPD